MKMAYSQCLIRYSRVTSGFIFDPLLSQQRSGSLPRVTDAKEQLIRNRLVRAIPVVQFIKYLLVTSSFILFKQTD